MVELTRVVALLLVMAATGGSTQTADFDDFIQTLSISADNPIPLTDIDWSTSEEEGLAGNFPVVQLGKLKLESLQASHRQLDFLLPIKYIGESSGFNDLGDRTSINLVIVSLLREFGFISNSELFAKLKERVPNAQTSLRNVSKRVEAIRLPIAVPNWFYDTLEQVGSMGHVAILTQLRRISGERRLALLAKVAAVWFRNCFSPLNRTRLYPACIPVEGGWTLTAPQISGYLMDLEIEELNNLIQRTRKRKSAGMNSN